MAKKPRPNKPADELKLEIARSRDEVARDLRALRYELDIPRRIRRSFREQTTLWIGAAAVVGTLIVLLPLRRKKLYVDLASGVKARPKSKLLEAGFVLGVLRIAATLLKPTIANFVAKKMHGYTGEHRPAAK
jgi:hypothetical protein